MTLFQPETVLTSTIEVGIAIAGFTGIVIALAKRDADANARALLVSVLLLTSIGSVTFSFLPMLLSLAGLPDSTVWATSSAVFIVYAVAVSVYRARQISSLEHRTPASFRAGVSLFVAGILLQIPNVFWWRTAWPYLVLIVVYVLYSFSVFVALVWDVWRDIHEDPGTESPSP